VAAAVFIKMVHLLAVALEEAAEAEPEQFKRQEIQQQQIREAAEAEPETLTMCKEL
jgi:hypothetical protein